MSEPRWTDAQRQAIEDEGGTLLVSAAAGSGKTAVLVERAVRLICREENPVPADRLLILTFTNAAADELRARIARRLEAELQARPGDFTLRRQRMLLRRAFIGTVDALCQQLVREHFSALALPPDVAIGDAALLQALAETAMAETMEEMHTARPEDFGRLCALYGRARSDAAAERAVRELYEFTRTLPHPAAQLARWTAMYTQEQPLCETPWGAELLATARGALDAAGRLNAAARALCAEDEALEGYQAALAEDAAAIEVLRAAVAAGDWNAAYERLALHRFAPLRAVRGYEGPAKARAQRLRDEVKGIFADLAKNCLVCSEETFAAERRQSAPLVAVLCEAAALFEERFLAAKISERVLDFADFEQYALALLQASDGSRTPAAAAICARFDAVMVDEYQDTNELQSALYASLARPAGDNLFFVGDVKQSIYRFRKANPGIFLAKKDAWPPLSAGGHPAVLTLGHNFRSGAGVIGGVNFVFGALMSRQLGDVEYGPQERLIQGGKGGDEAGFAFHLLEDAAGEGDAAYVAGLIRDMVVEGYTVRGAEGPRAVGYGDFCILLRARTAMHTYAEALAGLGIPVVADMAADILQTPEVLPLTAALACIDNPADDVSLAATLLGPLFGFTAEVLARLRAGAKRGSLWGALLQSEEPAAQKAVERLRFWRALSADVSAGRLCEELVQRTGYLSAVAAMEGGEGRRDNLLRFIAWAKEVSAAGRGGLGGFVRLVQAGRGPADAAAKQLPGHVTLLTIHKSKGLEFPVCILADTARSFNKSDRGARVQMHAELGLGLMLRQGGVLFHTLPSLAVRSRAGAEALGEEMRVLYVALTRARDKMVITLPAKDAGRLLAGRAAAIGPEGPDAYLLGRCQHFGDWLASALLCHPDADALRQAAGGATLPVLAAEGRLECGVYPVRPAEAGRRETYALTAAPDEALRGALAAAFARKPPLLPLAAVPRKVSVSALAKAGEAGGAILKRPSFMYKTGLTAAERGTAQHAFMQHADFAAAERDVGAEVARLAAEGLLSAEQAAAVQPEGVRRFLASALYGRIRAAAQVLRECDFITAIPAGRVTAGLAEPLAGRPVLVQGIADLVLVGAEGAEIVDYKTDRGAGPSELRRRYAGQLALYREAIEKRLSRPVTRLTIWSFALHDEVDLPC